MRKYAGRQLLQSALAALLIAGCNTRDVTPPRVQQVTPAAGATGARLDRPILVRFSEPLDPNGTANAVSLTVAGAPLAIDAELSSDDKQLEIYIKEQPAELPATVRVTLSDAIRDRAGNRLEPYSWQFELGDWIPLGGVLNHDPAHDVYAVDLAWWNGPLVVWGEDDPDSSNRTVFAAAWDDDTSSWRPLGAHVDPSDLSTCNFPSLAVYDGAPWVAQQCTVRGRQRVLVAHWDGAAWENSDYLNHDQSAGAYTPLLAAGDSLYAVWREWSAQASRERIVWSYLSGADWTAGMQDAAENSNGYKIWSVAAAGANLWAAFTDDPGSGNGAEVYNTSGGAWSRLGNGALDADGNPATVSAGVRLLVAAGKLYAFWNENGRVHAALWDGNGWSPLSGEVLPAGGGSQFVKAVAAAAGRLLVLVDDGNGTLHLRYRDVNSAEWRGYGGPLGADVWSAALAVDPGGWPYVAWMTPEGGAKHVRAAYYNHVRP